MSQILNRKASHEFEIILKYTAGIVLFGSEVKALRNSKGNISEAYCVFIHNELYIRNMSIQPARNAFQHEEKRDRKLLLNRKELNKLSNKMDEKGLTIVPLSVNIDGKIKVSIGLAKGKNSYDKRQSLKEKDLKRELQREL